MTLAFYVALFVMPTRLSTLTGTTLGWARIPPQVTQRGLEATGWITEYHKVAK